LGAGERGASTFVKNGSSNVSERGCDLSTKRCGKRKEKKKRSTIVKSPSRVQKRERRDESRSSRNRIQRRGDIAKERIFEQGDTRFSLSAASGEKVSAKTAEGESAILRKATGMKKNNVLRQRGGGGW